MINFKSMFAASFLAFSIIAAPFAGAANYTGRFSIIAVVTDADRFAGCMVKITPGPETIFPGCRTAFVSFGCDGTLGPSKTAGGQLLASSQLAFAMGKNVVLRINDGTSPLTPEGYCLADRVDVTNE